MNATQRALEALRRFLHGSDTSTEKLRREAALELAEEAATREALIADGVDPDEARIRSMTSFTDEEKAALIAELRRRRGF